MAEGNLSINQDVEKKILEIISENPKGVTNEVLESLLKADQKQYVICLNSLVNQKKIDLLQTKDGKIVFKLTSTKTQQYKGSDIEEKVVFEAVEKAGNNGIMTKDLKFQCHLPIPQINKILKALENKKMIKCFKLSPHKKIFMLYDLQPSEKVTGGTFYTGQDFESELVNVLESQCYQYLLKAKAVADELLDPITRRNTYKSSRDICDYINSLKISKIKLSVKDIEEVLQALIYDDKIERIVSLSKNDSDKESRMENLYRVSKPLAGSLGLMMLPCGICTVFQDCHVGGEISPATCIYMKQWLDF